MSGEVVMKFRYLAVAAFMLAGSAAHAERWYLAATSAQTRSYVDFDSFGAAGSMTRVNVLDIYPAGLTSGSTTIAASRILEEVNCANKTFRTMEYIFYKQDRSVMSLEPSDTINEWKVPSKGSLNEARVDMICARSGGRYVPDPFTDR
jgi:hypothetical protein